MPVDAVPQKAPSSTDVVFEGHAEMALSQIEQTGAAPWRQSWTRGRPFINTPKRPINAVNLLAAGVFETDNPVFLTVRKIKSFEGGGVPEDAVNRGLPLIQWRTRYGEPAFEIKDGRPVFADAPVHRREATYVRLYPWAMTQGVPMPELPELPAYEARQQRGMDLLTAFIQERQAPVFQPGHPRELRFDPERNGIVLCHPGDFDTVGHFLNRAHQAAAEWAIHNVGAIELGYRSDHPESVAFVRGLAGEMAASVAAAELGLANTFGERQRLAQRYARFLQKYPFVYKQCAFCASSASHGLLRHDRAYRDRVEAREAAAAQRDAQRAAHAEPDLRQAPSKEPGPSQAKAKTKAAKPARKTVKATPKPRKPTGLAGP